MKTTLTLIATALLAACASSSTTTAGAKPYPLDTCIVTDNKLGSMGTPITKTYGDQQVKFCCKPCIAKFEKSPERYLSKIQ